jgi:hypothetical protein
MVRNATKMLTNINKKGIKYYSNKFFTSSKRKPTEEIDLFKGLDRSKVHKINELIDALNGNNRLLEKQEDFLYEEHDKFVEVEKSLALVMKKKIIALF